MPAAQPKINKTLKRGGITGIAIGIFGLLVCELPILLAIVGFGGMGAGAMAFSIPVYIEVIAIGILILSVILLIYIKKRKTHQKE